MDFDAFYRDTSRRLLRYAYGLTGDPGEAQDLVQEAYARAWEKDAADHDPLIFNNQMLVHLDRSTGRTEGFDWATGASAWSVGPGPDRPVRVIGMGATGDEERVNQSGPPDTFTDGRFVQLTDAGAAEVRNVATGSLVRTVPVSSRIGETAVAHDGWLYSHDEPDHAAGPQHIRTRSMSSPRTAPAVSPPGRYRTSGSPRWASRASRSTAIAPRPASGSPARPRTVC